jgi:hypothetical protein
LKRILKYSRDYDLSLTIPKEDLDNLRKEASESIPKKTVTTLVQEIIKVHYNLKRVSTLTQADLDAIKEIWNTPASVSAVHYPVPVSDCSQEPVGLTIPESGDKPEQDKEIKPAFHLGEIVPGPGVVGRMKLYGIDPNKVIAAKRAMNAGREYDKELEKYFNLI